MIEADRRKVTAENVTIDVCGLFVAVEVSIPNISFAWSLNKPSKKSGVSAFYLYTSGSVFEVFRQMFRFTLEIYNV